MFLCPFVYELIIEFTKLAQNDRVEQEYPEILWRCASQSRCGG